MALFFDARWFDARLAAAGLDRLAASAALSISPEELGLIIKDQRELAPREVSLLAGLLGVSPSEMARHAGVGTPDLAAAPAASAAPSDARLLEAALEQIRALEARVARLEAQLVNKRDISVPLGNETLD
jgi:hypothetical protein